MSKEQLLKALDLLKSGNFQMGESWESAHQICQANEGSQMFDWLHALVHRIEGDDSNAAYWYRRVGRDQPSGAIEDEWQRIRREGKIS